MTPHNPSPVANPLNAHYEHRQNLFKSDRNAELPEVSWCYEDWLAQQNKLHVPQIETYESPFVNGVLDLRNVSPSWNESPCMMTNMQMTQEEKARMEMLKKKEAELCANLSDKQKELLNNIEQYLGKSKFEEED